MHKQLTKIYTLFLFTNILLSTLSVGLAGNEREKRQNPLSPKDFVIRYWDRSIHNNLPKPPFILSKVSPLSAADAEMFEELAVTKTLSTRLPEFCSAAHLVCLPNVTPSFTENPNATSVFVNNNDHNITTLNDALSCFPLFCYTFTQYNRTSASHDTNSVTDNQNFTALNNALWFLRYKRHSASHDTKPSVDNDNQNFTALNNALWFLRYNHHSASHDTNPSVDSDNQNITNVVEGPDVQGQKRMFFREMMLKEGNIIPMPDIRDKFPKRSFLPHSILTKLPFSSSKLNDLKHIFRVTNNSFMEKMIVNTLSECEWPANEGEIKRCVGSLEEMIDFATNILGRNVTIRFTENVNGSNKNVMIGQVKEMNGGKAPRFTACHQILFPYLLYYCHSVPKVRVYEVDLLDPNTKSKINHSIAVCHLDTSTWNPTHDAFLALGFGPGQIEVCHWVFENNLIWTNAY